MVRRDPRSDISRAAAREFRATADELTQCAEAAHAAFGPGGGDFRHKPDRSRVTSLDLDLESAWRDIIHRRLPDHSIIGEEHGVEIADPDFRWYLDPVDGTDDLTRGIPLYGYILALWYKGFPLVGIVGHPALGLRATAAFGEGARVNGQLVPDIGKRTPDDVAIGLPAVQDFLRGTDESRRYLRLLRQFPNSRTYRSVYAHVAVLTGALEAALEFDVAEWDLAATRLLIEEAGGAFREFRRYAAPGGVERLGAVFGSPALVDTIHSLLARAD